MSINSLDRKLGTPFQPARRVRDFTTSVFAEFTVLANQHNAVNLGQGFPNFPAPDFVKEAAQAAIAADLNQYARSAGHMRLVNALASLYGPLLDRQLDPQQEIAITDGATEAIFITMQALLEPGDEVILIEPFYDSYPASVTMAGGVPVFVPLRPGTVSDRAAGWTLDLDEISAAISSKTRLLVLNTPHNPLGKVFTKDELSVIAQLAQEHDFYVLSDEVYEWMVYPDMVTPSREVSPLATSHTRIAALPGMWERTITLGSAGKTFSVTGWKVGWAIAPPALIRPLCMAHQWVAFAVAMPLQEAVASALEQAQERNYFVWLREMYQGKRDRLLDVLSEVDLQPVVPDGSYFIIFDTANITANFDVPVDKDEPRDFAICRWFASHVGVAAIPPSPFYSPEHRHLTGNLARFCFCKTDATLDEAAIRLREKLG